MIRILLKNKIRTILNGFIKGSAKKRMIGIISIFASVFLFYMLMQWAQHFFTFILHEPAFQLSEADRKLLLERSVSIILNGLFLFLLMGGISISIHYLFSASDLPLLLATPIPLSTLFAYKTIETIAFNSGIFFFLGGSIIVGIGLLSQAPVYYFLIILPLTIIFISIPTTLALVGTMVLIRVFPATRIRELSSAMTGVFGLLIWLLIQYFRPDMLSPQSNGYVPGRIENITFLLRHNHPDWTPAAWFGKIITSLVLTDHPVPWLFFGLLTGIGVLFFIFSYKLAKAQFLKIGLLEKNAATNRRAKKLFRKRDNCRADHKPSIVYSIISKDGRLMWRDPRILIQIVLMTIIMIVVIGMMPNLESIEFVRYGNPTEAILVIMIVIVFVSSQNASRLVPLEGNAFWIMKVVPVSGKTIILSKLCFGFFLNQFLLIVVFSVITIYHRLSLFAYFYLNLNGLFVNLCSSSLGLLIGTWFPKFDWLHPKRMLQQTGNIILILFSVGLIILFSIIQVLLQMFVVDGIWLMVLTTTGLVSLTLIFALIAIKNSIQKMEKCVPEI